MRSAGQHVTRVALQEGVGQDTTLGPRELSSMWCYRLLYVAEENMGEVP